MESKLKVLGTPQQEVFISRWSISWDKTNVIVCAGVKWLELADGANLDTLEDFLNILDAVSRKTIESGIEELSKRCSAYRFTLNHPADDNLIIEGSLERIGEPDNQIVVMTALVSWNSYSSNHRLFSIMDTLKQAIFVHQDGKPVFANKAMADLFGIDDVEKIMAKGTFDQFIEPDQYKIIQDNFKLRAQGLDSSDDYEITANKENGDPIDIKYHVDLIDWGGKPAHLMSVFDVTERNSLKQEGRVSQELFRKIFDLSPDVTLIVDLETGRVIDVNSAFVELTGLSRKDAADKRAKDLPIWADNTVREWLTHKLHMKASARNMPIVLTARGGVYRQLNASAESIDMNGRQVLLIVARDISDDLHREKEMKKSRDEATLASRSKSEFLASMSHELRTPLNAILGFSEIINHEILGPVGDPKYKEYAHDIFSSGEHLLTIINGILDLSKVESGQLEMHDVHIHADDLATDCIKIVRGIAEEEKVNLHVDCPLDLNFYSDAKILMQVGINLLSNAIKFTPEDGDVYFKITSSAGNIIISVRDTGIGMTAKELEKAMKPFGQVENAESHKHHGSGLGLPLVQGFILQMGGEFLLNSESGNGTTAKIVLPIRAVF